VFDGVLTVGVRDGKSLDSPLSFSRVAPLVACF
jgi:hypothetical protein